jgi:hypothetical protein
MIGLVLDAILMLLLVAALAYGMRLERRLRALREGQLAFAGAVTELNQAASRAEAALASLRASGQETDLLHDRIQKARQVKAELEALIAKGSAANGMRAEPQAAPVRDAAPAAEAKPGLLSAEQVQTFRPVLQALAANQAAKQSLNRARRSLDDDLFAA